MDDIRRTLGVFVAPSTVVAVDSGGSVPCNKSQATRISRRRVVQSDL